MAEWFKAHAWKVKKRVFSHFITPHKALSSLAIYVLASSQIIPNLLKKTKQYQMAVSDFLR
jgi:hypothetical protein